MINYGEFDIKNIPKNIDITLRIAFKEKDLKKTINYCKKLKDKNISFFINPMHTNKYSYENLIFLLKEVNNINPLALTITDTIGAMNEKETKEIFNFIDEGLNPEIEICFHSHNNLNLSLKNAICLTKQTKNRNLIIDSTIFGIGRGAGNISTESLINILNKNYDLKIIENIKEKYIMPLYNKTPWGYNNFYHLSAVYNCHPNYAKFLLDKNISFDAFEKIIKQIPQKEKLIYNQKLVENLYLKI